MLWLLQSFPEQLLTSYWEGFLETKLSMRFQYGVEFSGEIVIGASNLSNPFMWGSFWDAWTEVCTHKKEVVDKHYTSIEKNSLMALFLLLINQESIWWYTIMLGSYSRRLWVVTGWQHRVN
jgi:hypothetical protein